MSRNNISFDRVADQYDNTRGFPPGVESIAGRMIQQISGLQAESRLLEIGVGTGRVAIPLAAASTARIHGIDISAGMLRKLLEKRVKAAVYPVQGDVTRLPYPDNTFDAVLAVHVFHLLPDFQPAEAELRRILKPEGLVIQAWNSNDSIIADARRKLKESLRAEQSWSRSWQNAMTILEDHGWSKLDRERTHDYTNTVTPRHLLESFENRLWSSTWEAEEDQLKAGVDEIRRLLEAEYDDLDAPVDLKFTLYINAYTPPSS
jgi:ubiquinone/menaquinone biosynthesis C-methylase UbiE